MLFDLELLGKPDANGNATVVESRTHGGASVEEAVRHGKNNRPEHVSARNLRLPPNKERLRRNQKFDSGKQIFEAKQTAPIVYRVNRMWHR
jgi:hypothetical protein